MKKMKWAFGLAAVFLFSASQNCVLQSCAEEQEVILAEESEAILSEESGIILEDVTDAADSGMEGLSAETGQYGQNAADGGEDTIYIEEIESIDESQIPDAVSVGDVDTYVSSDEGDSSVSSNNGGLLKTSMTGTRRLIQMTQTAFPLHRYRRQIRILWD
ncbi:MAG: hypothetical protein LUH53_02485 [Lachnospiraceae bacterium]|nr:hypothetical protein [Lachnospiraceae bacterium]